MLLKDFHMLLDRKNQEYLSSVRKFYIELPKKRISISIFVKKFSCRFLLAVDTRLESVRLSQSFFWNRWEQQNGSAALKLDIYGFRDVQKKSLNSTFLLCFVRTRCRCLYHKELQSIFKLRKMLRRIVLPSTFSFTLLSPSVSQARERARCVCLLRSASNFIRAFSGHTLANSFTFLKSEVAFASIEQAEDRAEQYK